MQKVGSYDILALQVLGLIRFCPQDIKSLPEKYFSDQISITSETGVGSSTTLNGLKNVLSKSTRFVSGGDMMRLRAKQCRYESVEQLASAAAEGDTSHDKWLDQQLVLYGAQNYLVMEGRLAHLWTPMGFNVRLICPIDVRAKRRAAQLHRPEHVVRESIETRDEDDNSRYQSLYPGCLWDNAAYDLVIDTSEHDEKEVVSLIVENHSKWLETKRHRQLLCYDVQMFT